MDRKSSKMELEIYRWIDQQMLFGAVITWPNQQTLGLFSSIDDSLRVIFIECNLDICKHIHAHALNQFSTLLKCLLLLFFYKDFEKANEVWYIQFYFMYGKIIIYAPFGGLWKIVTSSAQIKLRHIISNNRTFIQFANWIHWLCVISFNKTK